MKRLIPMLYLLILLIPSSVHSQNIIDGNMLLNECSFELKDNIPNSDSVGLAHRAFCIGYLSGVKNLGSLYAAWIQGTQKKPLFCTPYEVTTGQIIRVVVKFLNDHPERLHEHALFMVVDAMGQAFPCE